MLLDLEIAYDPIPRVGDREAIKYSFQRIEQTARELDVPDQLLSLTLEVFDEMVDVCPITALECILTAYAAVDKAAVVKQIDPELEVEPKYIFAAALVHDAGKLDVPQHIRRASELGGEHWRHDEMYQYMMLHSEYGANRLRNRGFPDDIWKPVLNNHSKQLGRAEYGGDREDMTSSQKITTDVTSTTDSDVACLARNNSNNRSLSIEDRVELCVANNMYVFNDYGRRDAIVGGIRTLILPKIVLVA